MNPIGRMHQHITLQYNLLHCNTIQCSSLQYNTFTLNPIGRTMGTAKPPVMGEGDSSHGNLDK